MNGVKILKSNAKLSSWQSAVLDMCFSKIFEWLFPRIRLSGCYWAQDTKNMIQTAFKGFYLKYVIQKSNQIKFKVYLRILSKFLDKSYDLISETVRRTAFQNTIQRFCMTYQNLQEISRKHTIFFQYIIYLSLIKVPKVKWKY